MPPRPAPLRVLVGLVLVALLTLVSGCGDDAPDRSPGDPVSAKEADVLSGLLYRNVQAGGADFVLSAPYAPGAVLTLTGAVDFAGQLGRARAVTTYDDGRPEDTRTLFFTADALWFGDVPGLPEALADAGLPEAGYLRRPIAAAGEDGTAALVDVLVQMVPRLSARAPDDPRSFGPAGYTWQGARSIDGQLASVFRSGGGATIAVGAESTLLLQYTTTLPGQDFDVTITLSDHGPRDIALPSDAETVSAGDHPDIAAALGI